MTQDKKFLGTEPVGRLLWRLAVPTVIAQLVNMLYNIVDRIYIGHIPETGSMALTGVGVCLPIIMIISAFAAFVSSGGAPRASIAMGRGDYDQAQRILGGCFTLQVAISLVLTAVLLIWNRPLLLAFGASGNTIEYAAQYMGVYALGTLFVELTLGLNAFITAQGFAQVGMKTVLIGAVVNILLDPLFIFVLDMGVRGAALATVLSQGISCVWVISFLRGKKTLLRLEKAALPIRPRLILPCVALGTAAFIMQASESVISVCFNASLLKYGGDLAVGAMTILSSVMQFAMLPLQGIAQGAQPISSYNYGAGNAQRVRQTFWLLLKVSLGYALVLWGCIQLFPGVFARIFTPDAELVAFTAGDLSAAPPAGRPDPGRVPGGAGGRRHRRHRHGDPVLLPVPQGPAGPGNRQQIVISDRKIAYCITRPPAGPEVLPVCQKSLAEFAARRLRITFYPFFAAACTSRKILCAERVCFHAFHA